MNKNFLGLGPNVTALLLGGIFFGTYFGSSWATRKMIMEKTEDPNPPRYFRDITVKKD